MRQRLILIRDELTEIRLVASSLAFSTLLSIIPFLVLVLAGFQYIGGLEELYPKVEAILFSYMREATGSAVSKYLRSTLEQVDFRTLGISGALLLLWSSTGLIRNIDYAFNRLWKHKIEVPFFRRLWMWWGILMAVPVGLALFIGVRSFFLWNDRVRTLEHQFVFSLWIWGFIFLMYKYIPAAKVRTLPAMISSMLVSLILFVVQKSFFWISASVFRQNKIYGSLASAPIFLIWLLLMWYVVLIGVSFCAFLQQKLAKSS